MSEYLSDTETWCDVHAVEREMCGCPFLPGGAYPTEEREHHGQARIAYRLAGLYAGKLMFVHGLGWYVWDGKRWAPDDRGATKRAVLAVLRRSLAESLGDQQLSSDVRKCESAAGIQGVMDIASALEPFAVTAEDLDADPYLLNVANGTLDLRTLTMRAHDPGDRLTMVTRAAWDPQGRSQEWEGFLERVLPDEGVRGYFQRFVGLSLLGSVREHLFTIATGEGANGKGTSYNAVLNALGDYGHVAESDLFMQAKSNPNGASPAVFALRGKRLVVVSETEQDHRLAVALMKNLTGGDPITARPLYGSPVTFKPSHSALMVTNYLPKVQGNDPAAWRRIRVIPFDVTIPEGERDGQLGERLELAADAILAWAVRGFQEYLEHGMDDPPAVKSATGEYLKASDAVARFIEEVCVLTPMASVRLKILFEQWQAWSEGDDTQRLGKLQFAREMTGHGYPPDSSNNRVLHGIGLRAEEAE